MGARSNIVDTWATDQNSQVAKLLGYSKHCHDEGCTIYHGLRRWPFYDGLPDFSTDAERQVEILDWFRSQRLRGTLVVRLTFDDVTIMQGHYFVKGTDLSDAIWQFVTWVIQHELLLLDSPDRFVLS